MSAAAPSSCGFLIPGKRGNILAHCYLPGGEGPKPVVAVMHGIPGNERLFDFSIALREQGFCTVNFHYSGSWGSEGDYSADHCMEDTAAVIGWVTKNEPGCFDTEKIFVVGHSLGGLMASFALAELDAVKGGVLMAPFDLRNEGEKLLSGQESFLDELFSDQGPGWLQGFDRGVFTAAMADHPERYDLTTYAAGIAKKPVLMCVCTNDTVCPIPVHGGREAAAVRACGGEQLTVLEFEDDHCFNCCRPAAREAVCDFLKSLL